MEKKNNEKDEAEKGAGALIEELKRQERRKIIESGILVKLGKLECSKCGHNVQRDDVYVFNDNWDPWKEQGNSDSAENI